MGNFDTITRKNIYFDMSPSASGRHNIPDVLHLFSDLNAVKHALITAGLLQKGVPPSKTRDVINCAIQSVQKNLRAGAQTMNAQKGQPEPDSTVTRAIQHIIAQERLARSHQLIADSPASSQPQNLINGGMKRALNRLHYPHSPRHELGAAQRRALLPTISMQTFQTNRRLAEALCNDGEIANLEMIVASTISNNGKQGYSDVKDFIQVLQSRAPEFATRFTEKVQCELEGIALRRFHKLLHDQPPVESDFND